MEYLLTKTESDRLKAVNGIYELIFDMAKIEPIVANLFRAFDHKLNEDVVGEAFHNAAQIAIGLEEKLDVDLSRDIGVVVLGLSETNVVTATPDGAAEWIGSRYKGNSKGIGWITKKDETKHVAHIINPSVLPKLPISKLIKEKLERNEIKSAIVVHSFEVSDTAKHALKDLYKLTFAEIDVCVLLTKGKSLNEIADERGVVRETIKSHLKNIYAKMGVRRQTMLVRLLTQIFAASAIHSFSWRDDVNLQPDWKNGLESFSTIFIKSKQGSRICFSRFGDPNGKPLVYIHHGVGSRWHSRQMAEAAKKNKILIIKPDRPGFGHSDLLAVDQPKLLAQFYESLLDYNNIKSAHFLAYGFGGRSLLDAASYFESRIEKISLWSFMGGPKINIAPEKSIGGLGESLAQWAWKNPVLRANYLRIVRLGLVDEVNAAKNLRKHHARSPADSEALKNIETIRDMFSEIKLSGNQEFKGSLLDHKKALEPFACKPGSLRDVVVNAFYGADDIFSNFESNDAIFNALPSWRHYSIEAAGQLLPNDDFGRFLSLIMQPEIHDNVIQVSSPSAN